MESKQAITSIGENGSSQTQIQIVCLSPILYHHTHLPRNSGEWWVGLALANYCHSFLQGYQRYKISGFRSKAGSVAV